MRNTSVAVCTYHHSLSGEGNKIILDFVNQQIENFFLLFDNQKNLTLEEVSPKYNNAAISFYNDDDFKKYGFDKPIHKNHFWGNHQNPKYFYAHYRMLVHYINNPNFDYYWYFDDDIRLNGDLKNFLNEFDELENDFMAIQIFKKEDYLDYPKVNIINDKMLGSRGHWLGLCPGPGDNFKSTEKHMGCFFPITRFSKKAFEYLLEIHREGYFGYSEGFVPTSLASAGYQVFSMMDEFDNYNIDIKTKCEILHKGDKFKWSWL